MPEQNIIDTELYISIGKQIKKARLEKGISLDTLSNLIGGIKTKSTLKRYEDGKSRIEVDTLKLICDQLSIDYLTVINIARDNLKKDDTLEDSKIKVNPSNVIEIPLYSSISCGTGIFVDDSIEDYIAVPKRYLKKGTEYFANTAAGDSMIGKGIKDGDILVFEKTNILESGQIGSFCIGESEAVCKTLRKLQNGMIMLESANDAYDPIVVDLSDECFRVIGKYKFKFSVEQ